MKRLAFIAIILSAVPAVIFADTLYDYSGDSVTAWKMQAVYTEKYNEKKIYYKNYNALADTFEIDDTNTIPAYAMQHDIMFRMGLPDNFTADVRFLYIYQKAGDLNYNNLQTMSLFVEKYNEWWGFLAGLKIPFQYGMEYAPGIINSSDEFNAIIGMFIKSNAGIFQYSVAFYDEECIFFARDYQGDTDFTASAGVNVYSSDLQTIDFTIETAYRTRKLQSEMQSALYVAPQIKVDFYNDFYFVIGAEFYLAAVNMFMPDRITPQYIAKFNYVLNSEKRAEKQKPEEKKTGNGEKKWWQIDGVDDEMIPESWKDEVYMKSIGKFPGQGQ